MIHALKLSIKQYDRGAGIITFPAEILIRRMKSISISNSDHHTNLKEI